MELVLESIWLCDRPDAGAVILLHRSTALSTCTFANVNLDFVESHLRHATLLILEVAYFISGNIGRAPGRANGSQPESQG
ncbi:hypothetical protein LshimejAT787_1800540 [Lyophyllum shimeji]|uniref:Uncharacterized protein n=1 Tax=Lyophyllum shimeji TaxID=47721 RepID=A0A9P3Q0Q1_LYOSH|nr:hypothetical protein LshimejAT787_1800540 [Lyophyllum shimeji]